MLATRVNCFGAISLKGLCPNQLCRGMLPCCSVSSQELKNFNDIPGPKKLPILGHIHLFSRFGPYSLEKLYDAYEDIHAKYGPIARLDLGQTLVLLFRPEDVQRLFHLEGNLPQRPLFEALRHYRMVDKRYLYRSAGLVSENGEKWWRLRKEINFMMKPHFAQNYLLEQSKIADDFVLRIRRLKNLDGVIEDFLKELYRYTEEAIGLVCFGTRLGLFQESEHISDRSRELNDAAEDTLEALAETLLGFPWWKIVKTRAYKKLTRSQEVFYNFAMECLENAKFRVEGDGNKDEQALEFLRTLLQKEQLQEKDVRLLMIEIFSAGIDATGNALAFLFYNMTKRPDVQDRLFQEIQQCVPPGKEIMPDDLNKMNYLRACIKESYRLTPAVGGIARIFSSSTAFCGYKIPANVLCLGANPVICRQSRYFDDPLSYRPERWLLSGGESRVHPHCIVPFSHGVRRCVGQRFAENEIRLCVIKVVQNFRLAYNGPTIGTKMRLNLMPDRPLDLQFLERGQ